MATPTRYERKTRFIIGTIMGLTNAQTDAIAVTDELDGDLSMSESEILAAIDSAERKATCSFRSRIVDAITTVGDLADAMAGRRLRDANVR